jgi:hypothetical protein
MRIRLDERSCYKYAQTARCGPWGRLVGIPAAKSSTVKVSARRDDRPAGESREAVSGGVVSGGAGSLACP